MNEGSLDCVHYCHAVALPLPLRGIPSIAHPPSLHHQPLSSSFLCLHRHPVHLLLFLPDPTYMIRAIPPNASDNIYCTLLAHGAVHGAMAGFSGFIIGPVNNRQCYIPMHRVTSGNNTVSLSDRMWGRLMSSTSQPSFLSVEDNTKKGSVNGSVVSSELSQPTVKATAKDV